MSCHFDSLCRALCSRELRGCYPFSHEEEGWQEPSRGRERAGYGPLVAGAVSVFVCDERLQFSFWWKTKQNSLLSSLGKVPSPLSAGTFLCYWICGAIQIGAGGSHSIWGRNSVWNFLSRTNLFFSISVLISRCNFYKSFSFQQIILGFFPFFRWGREKKLKKNLY